MMALLIGGKIALDGYAPWLAEAGYPVSFGGQVKVRISDLAARREREVLFHPKTLVAGIGAERGVGADEVIALIDGVAARARRWRQSLWLRSPPSTSSPMRRRSTLPPRTSACRCASSPSASSTRSATGWCIPPRSSRPKSARPGVAEAAALKAGTLIVPKRKSKRATCAIGRAPTPIDPLTLGHPPGMLHVVGVGPGDKASRTASAVAALDASTDWVGYGLYLDLVADLRTGQVEHRFPLGDEEARVRHALELAGKGKAVALICSGDAQIYAMAALVFELIDAIGERRLTDAGRRVPVEIHPGISAVQAASAAAGALIGHDFCCISLSDLLTPANDIRKRLKAAAEADFVTALYNPRSERRTGLIEEAKEMFLRHRAPETPVIVASNLGRPAEAVELTTLWAFEPMRVDMLTIVLIGSSTSKTLKRGDGNIVAFTPRGYAKKAQVMTVYFIGAGPGAPDLITVRGQKLIERCPVCLYAGSLVPAEIVAAAPADALVRDTAPDASRRDHRTDG